MFKVVELQGRGALLALTYDATLPIPRGEGR